MTAGDNESEQLSGAYTAAVAKERAAWRAVQDPALDESQRVAAHRAWLRAAEEMKQLAARIKTASAPAPGRG